MLPVISEWFITMGVAIGDWFISLFPEWQPPAELEAFDSTVNGFIAPFAGLSAWIPWVLVFLCVGVALLVWLIGWGVKSISWLWGQIPVIGGSG